MRQQKKGVLVFGLLIAVSFLFLFYRDREPEIRGRSLSSLLKAYELADSAGLTAEAEDIAREVREIGTNAVPWLLNWLNNATPEWKFTLHRKIDPIISKIWRNYEWNDGPLGRQVVACFGFRILGTTATNAIPELGRMLRGSNDLASFHSALSLRYIGPPAWPNLLSALTNRDEKIWDNVHQAIDGLGTDASFAIPTIVAALGDADAALRYRAARALVALPIEPELVVPALIKALGDPDQDAQHEIICALGEQGFEARAAIPALLTFSNAPAWYTRRLAERALNRIDPNLPPHNFTE